MPSVAGCPPLPAAAARQPGKQEVSFGPGAEVPAAAALRRLRAPGSGPATRPPWEPGLPWCSVDGHPSSTNSTATQAPSTPSPGRARRAGLGAPSPALSPLGGRWVIAIYRRGNRGTGGPADLSRVTQPPTPPLLPPFPCKYPLRHRSWGHGVNPAPHLGAGHHWASGCPSLSLSSSPWKVGLVGLGSSLQNQQTLGSCPSPFPIRTSLPGAPSLCIPGYHGKWGSVGWARSPRMGQEGVPWVCVGTSNLPPGLPASYPPLTHLSFLPSPPVPHRTRPRSPARSPAH